MALASVAMGEMSGAWAQSPFVSAQRERAFVGWVVLRAIVHDLVSVCHTIHDLLTDNAGVLTLQVDEFVMANGRRSTDEMAYADAPLHMLQFMPLGQRKARAYLAKRGAPWPPIPL